MPVLIGLIIVLIIVGLIVTYWYVVLPVALVILLAVMTPGIIRRIRKNRYFASEEFLRHKDEIASVVAEHNEIADYVSDLRGSGSFQLGRSSTATQAHLASFENTSNRGYRRDRNVANYGESNVHNCSLQVVRNASADPIKYLMKYFNIKAEEVQLTNIESLGETIARLESAIDNLHRREASITSSINPPSFILKHYNKELMEHVGVTLSPITVPFPVYVFEYVSAGGNSSQKTTVTLNTPTIDALIGTLSEKIRFKSSAAGQRALMTAKLREFIKSRDQYTCRLCAVSIDAEPHLLLEVDHVHPISKGGKSTEENLQTLCWKCNRSKSNKIIPA